MARGHSVAPYLSFSPTLGPLEDFSETSGLTPPAPHMRGWLNNTVLCCVNTILAWGWFIDRHHLKNPQSLSIKSLTTQKFRISSGVFSQHWCFFSLPHCSHSPSSQLFLAGAQPSEFGYQAQTQSGSPLGPLAPLALAPSSPGVRVVTKEAFLIQCSFLSCPLLSHTFLF